MDIEKLKNETDLKHGYQDGILGNAWDFAMQLTHRTKRLIELYEEVIRALAECSHEEKAALPLPNVIYCFLYPFRNSYKNKLKALLEGLETQNVDKLLKEGKTGDFRNYGKAYIGAVRTKVDKAKTCR